MWELPSDQQEVSDAVESAWSWVCVDAFQRPLGSVLLGSLPRSRNGACRSMTWTQSGVERSDYSFRFGNRVRRQQFEGKSSRCT